MAARNFKLFLGCLGNGVTVCNSAVMEDGDFKMVAHISNEGKITWYVGEDYPPADALASIRACAEQERVKYETWVLSFYLFSKSSLFNCFGAACAQGRVFCVLANGIAVNPAAFAFMAFSSFNGNFQIFAGCCLACFTNAFMQFCLRYD